jgi:hypothetical protein
VATPPLVSRASSTLTLRSVAASPYLPVVDVRGVGGSASSDSARIEALRQGLRELGYVEGKNIVIEYRYPERKPDRLREPRNPCPSIPTTMPALPLPDECCLALDVEPTDERGDQIVSDGGYGRLLSSTTPPS